MSHLDLVIGIEREKAAKNRLQEEVMRMESEIANLRATIERSDIHAESSRICAFLASAIRSGASDEQVGRIARGLHEERTTKDPK